MLYTSFGLDVGLEEVAGALNPACSKENISEFSEGFEEKTGLGSVYPTYMGRSALYLVLKALGLEGKEAIMPSFTCTMVPDAMLLAGVKPVLCDIEPDSYNLEPESMKEAIGPKTKAVVAVHTFGNPCRMKEIGEIAQDKGLLLIEDCAHALGAEYKGQRVGTFGDAAIFSFGTDKIMTTGWGGMAGTNDEEIARKMEKAYARFGECTRAERLRARKRIIAKWTSKYRALHLIKNTLIEPGLRLAQTGTTKEKRAIDGTVNFTLKKIAPEAARAGIVQLGKLDGMNGKRIRNAELLTKLIHGELETPKAAKAAKHVFLRYTAKAEDEAERDALIKRLQEKGIDASNSMWDTAIHHMKRFDGRVRAPVGLRETEEVMKRMIQLPNHPMLSEENIKGLAENIKEP